MKELIKMLQRDLKLLMESADKMADMLCAEYPYIPNSVKEYHAALTLFQRDLKEYNKKKVNPNLFERTEIDLAAELEDEIRAEAIELANLNVD